MWQNVIFYLEVNSVHVRLMAHGNFCSYITILCGESLALSRPKPIFSVVAEQVSNGLQVTGFLVGNDRLNSGLPGL